MHATINENASYLFVIAAIANKLFIPSHLKTFVTNHHHIYIRPKPRLNIRPKCYPETYQTLSQSFICTSQIAYRFIIDCSLTIPTSVLLFLFNGGSSKSDNGCYSALSCLINK